ncbi:MAG: DNA polymerase III subunit delta', partial [Pseudomonadota bacterium]
MAEAAIPEPDRAEGCPHPRETRLRFGQGPAEAAYLQSVAAGRLHHAWALTGPAGIGKATLAWAMARHLAAGGRAPDLTTDPDSAIYRRSLQLAEPAIALVRRAWDDKAKR